MAAPFVGDVAAVPARQSIDGSSRSRLAIHIPAGALLLVLAITYAYYFVFSRPMSPDEGYLMITVQSFLGHNALYDSVFTQYGPFYYFYEYVLHALAGIPLTHDATRMICIAHWLGTAALFAWAAGKFTRSPMAALFVFAQTAVHLSRLADEPGHPQEVVALLLGLGMIAALKYGERPGALAGLAIVSALLVFTKINVGIFFGLALFLALRGPAKEGFAGLAETWLLAIGSAALPFLLMRRHLAEAWCRNYSFVVAAAVTAALLVARRSAPKSRFTSRQWMCAVTSFALASLALLAVTMATGTTLQGLVDGLVLTPMKMPAIAVLPLAVPNAAVINAIAALAVALSAVWWRDERRVAVILAVLKGVFAIAGCFFVLNDAAAQLACLLPWTWLVLVPAVRDSDVRAHSHQLAFRIFLSLAGTLLALQAYPIAGTQVTTGTLLLVMAYSICLHDAVGTALSLKTFRNRIGASTPRTIQFASALLLVALLWAFANAWCRLPVVRREYAALPALGLPGSERVHMDAESTEMYRALAAFLRDKCDTFVTYPGINSLYFWTGKQPPTHLNSTGWGQLSHAQQGAILKALFDSPRPMLAVVAAAADSWSTDAPPQIAPLIRCVREDCREAVRIGRFIVFVPKDASTNQRGK